MWLKKVSVGEIKREKNSFKSGQMSLVILQALLKSAIYNTIYNLQYNLQSTIQSTLCILYIVYYRYMPYLKVRNPVTCVQ